MPGISGFCARASIAEPGKLLELYNKVHALNGVRMASASVAHSGAVILNLRHRLSEHDPHIGQGRHVFVEGELFDTGSGPVDDSSLPKLLWTLYERVGSRLSENVNGEYNIVLLDRDESRVTLIADHLSTQPMYYLETAEGLHFGSEKKSILAAMAGAPEIDPIGLLQIFCHRHFVGNRTYIKDIKRLMPGEVLEYSRGHIRLSRARQVEFEDSSTRIADLVEEWQSILGRATEKRIRDCRLVISLSGGLDSRMVALSIPRSHRPVWARTRGYESSYELQFARRIAAGLGLEHFAEDPDSFSFSDAIDAIVWRTEGEATVLNGPTLLNHQQILEHGDALAGGYLGDVSSGSHIDARMFIPMTHRKFAETIYDWYRPPSAAALGRVFQPRFLEQHLSAVRDAFIASYSAAKQDRNVDTHQAWDLYNRQTRMTMAASPVDSHVLRRVSPFYDREALGFATRIPLRLRVGQALYKALIFHSGSEIRDVPNSTTLQLVKPGILGNRYRYLFESTSRLRSKLMKRFATPAALNARLRPSEQPGELLRKDPGFRTRIEAFCRSGNCDREIFNVSGISELLDKHYSGAEQHGSLIALLGTFASALPMFVYGRPTSCPDTAQPARSFRRERPHGHVEDRRGGMSGCRSAAT